MSMVSPRVRKVDWNSLLKRTTDPTTVSPRMRGVDWNKTYAEWAGWKESLPSYEGSGLKLIQCYFTSLLIRYRAFFLYQFWYFLLCQLWYTRAKGGWYNDEYIRTDSKLAKGEKNGARRICRALRTVQIVYCTIRERKANKPNCSLKNICRVWRSNIVYSWRSKRTRPFFRRVLWRWDWDYLNV